MDMPVMIPIENAISKRTIGVRNDLILIVEPSAENPLMTRVVTTMNFGKGPVIYETFQTVEEIMDMMYKAARGELVPPPPDKMPSSLVAS